MSYAFDGDVISLRQGSGKLVCNLKKVERIHFIPQVMEIYFARVPKPLVVTMDAELANRRTNWVVLPEDEFVNLISEVGYYIDKIDYKGWEVEQFGENADTDNVPYDDWAVRVSGLQIDL